MYTHCLTKNVWLSRCLCRTGSVAKRAGTICFIHPYPAEPLPSPLSHTPGARCTMVSAAATSRARPATGASAQSSIASFFKKAPKAKPSSARKAAPAKKAADKVLSESDGRNALGDDDKSSVSSSPSEQSTGGRRKRQPTSKGTKVQDKTPSTSSLTSPPIQARKLDVLTERESPSSEPSGDNTTQLKPRSSKDSAKEQHDSGKDPIQQNLTMSLAAAAVEGASTTIRVSTCCSVWWSARCQSIPCIHSIRSTVFPPVSVLAQ